MWLRSYGSEGQERLLHCAPFLVVPRTMQLRSTIADLVRTSFGKGSLDELTRELGDLKAQLGGLQRRLDEDLGPLAARLKSLEEARETSSPKGRGRLAVLDHPLPSEPVSGESNLSGPFTSSLSIREVLSMRPGAAEVLSRHHLPSCGSCAVSSLESLEVGLRNHGVALDVVLDELNQLPWN